jgi:hypothetical protein
MEYIVFNCVHDHLSELVSRLAIEFNIPVDQALQILEENGDWYERGTHAETRCPEDTDTQCDARIWNGGHGARCSRKSINGSEFCTNHGRLKFPRICMGCIKDYNQARHHDYIWQHLGRWNDPLPKSIELHKLKTSGV